MSRRTRKSAVRGAHLSLWLASLLLSTTSCRDDRLTAPSDSESAVGGPALAATATRPLAFLQVSGGSQHTCGVTTEHRAYCWGVNAQGELGNGTTSFSSNSRPVRVIGGLRFRQVSAGSEHSCGVTTDYRAYCWGLNHTGQLGDGTYNRRLEPVSVQSGLLFRQVSAGEWYTCGLTYPDRRAYCWGYNYHGQLGDGTMGLRVTPTPVASDRRFRNVSAADRHTCAVTTSDKAFCWGANRYGQLGSGTQYGMHPRPVRVAGGLLFRQVSAGRRYSCGTTTDNRAYCWGYNNLGQLGDGGTTIVHLAPTAVAGGLNFRRVSAGTSHTCGETTADLAYCWGNNWYGEIGDGTTDSHLTPKLVAGGLTFSEVSAGGWHTCGRTPAAVAYCWGLNDSGQLGDGSVAEQSSTPVAVADPM